MKSSLHLGIGQKFNMLILSSTRYLIICRDLDNDIFLKQVNLKLLIKFKMNTFPFLCYNVFHIFSLPESYLIFILFFSVLAVMYSIYFLEHFYLKCHIKLFGISVLQVKNGFKSKVHVQLNSCLSKHKATD